MLNRKKIGQSTRYFAVRFDQVRPGEPDRGPVDDRAILGYSAVHLRIFIEG